MKKVALVTQIVLYLAAGINHFWHRQFYLKIMPTYFPQPQMLNYLAGFAEIFLALLLIWPNTRKLAAWGIILMLILFLTVHIDMIEHNPIKWGGNSVPTLLIWLRLPLQAVLIYWAWIYTRK